MVETHKGRRFIPSPDTKIQSITAGSGGTPVVQALVRIMCLRPGYVMRNCLIKGGGQEYSPKAVFRRELWDIVVYCDNKKHKQQKQKAGR